MLTALSPLSSGHNDIAQIRLILERYQDDATIYLGGAPMIADDLVTFVQNDLTTFSIGVFALSFFALGIIFRRLRWIFLPLACCANRRRNSRRHIRDDGLASDKSYRPTSCHYC